MSSNSPLAKTTASSFPTSGPAVAAAAAVPLPTTVSARPSKEKGDQHGNYQQQQEDASALIISASGKAGMDGIDRSRIDAIILRESGNSLYMRQQRKRDAKVNERIERLREKLDDQNRQDPEGMWRTQLEASLEREIRQVTAGRPEHSFCCVVDMDMFYMACELLSKPGLANVPACVGHGMITTSNYVARRYGVRSAMAGYIGDRLVEELSGGALRLVHVDHHFDLYREKSHAVRRVLAEYDPNLRAYSLDEVYMDLRRYLRQKLRHPDWDHDQISRRLSSSSPSSWGINVLEGQQEQQGEEGDRGVVDAETVENGDPDESENSDADDVFEMLQEAEILQATDALVREMRSRVCEATGGLTCSAGVASTFTVAKIASDHNKPNGLCVVTPDSHGVLSFLHPLPTRKVGGIGRVTEKMLKAFGIHTVRDLYEHRALVRLLFQPATAGFLLRASLGCSSSSSDGNEGDDDANNDENEAPSSSAQQKGISRERTFRAGQSWTVINGRLEDIARMLSGDMQRKNLWGRTVTVKVKLHTFDCLSKSRTLRVYVQAANDLAKHATTLLGEIRKEFAGQFNVRLLGIRLSNFRGDNDDSKFQSTIDPFLARGRFGGCDSGHGKTFATRTHSPIFGKSSTGTAREEQRTLETFLLHGTESDGPGDDGGDEVDDEQYLLRVDCPVCGRQFSEKHNAALNRHLDHCLNSHNDDDEIEYPAASGGSESKTNNINNKRQKITDFFAKPKVST